MAENDNEKPSGDTEKDPRLLYAEDEQESGVFRWMSGIVVLLAVAGFFGLAWYAYKSGGDAVDEKDVELVKADKAPVKETPANPGGMQIPNQDKTVYGLINGNKTDKPTVERILPAPEEPIARGGDTETWMSDKAKNKVSGEEGSDKTTEAAAAAPVPVTPAPATIDTAPSEPKKAEQFKPEQVQTAQNDQVVAAAPQEVPAKPEVPAVPAVAAKPAVVAQKPVAQEKPEPVVAAPVAQAKEEDEEEAAPVLQKQAPVKAAAPEPASATKAPAKGPRIQLGAYKSEAEAKTNWAKIAKQFANETSGKEHYILRADLGEKGIYYRLQVAPFASAKEAEEFCLTFVSAGQNCFLAKAR